MVARESIRVGVDIGGTFTDLVASNDRSRVWKIKVLTTPTDPSIGVINAVRKLLEQENDIRGSVRVAIHATTLASNALLTGNVARTALVTTRGFRDVLEIGRQNRPELYNLQVERLKPLVPRKYRFEVSERTTFEGRILEPLDLSQVQRVAEKIRRMEIGAVAICLLHSYANPKHEKMVGSVFRRVHPSARLSLSCDLLPEFREYERTSTVVVNACLQPLFAEYLEKIQRGLEGLDVGAPVFVMQSNSGTVLAQQAAVEPARLIESGPVAGAVASRFYSRGSGKIISLDVGGTTSKAGVWSGHGFELTSEYEVGGRLHGSRRVEGSGYPVRFPVVDLVEVGIGGGSIAWVDDARILHVGPQSAGASPGPACYGKRGQLPTVTDACLVLGRLSPSFLLGGDLALRPELAQRAILERVGRPLGRRVVSGALGVLRIAIAKIAEALRAATVERGLDPREMTLVAFGGAGPMFACEVATELGIGKVVVPPGAGLLSSTGLLLAEPLHDFVRTVLVDSNAADTRLLERVFQEMERRAANLFRMEGVTAKDVRCQRLMDLRYRGQSYELSILLRENILSSNSIPRAVRDFHRKHQVQYGYSQRDMPVEIVNVRVYCRGRPGSLPKMRVILEKGNLSLGARRAWFSDDDGIIVRVLRRGGLSVGARGRGPCILEDYDSTLVVSPRARYVVEGNGSVSIGL